MIASLRNIVANQFEKSPRMAGFQLALIAQLVLGGIVLVAILAHSALAPDGDGLILFIFSFLCGLPFILLTAGVLNVSPTKLAGPVHAARIAEHIEANRGAVGAFRVGFLGGPVLLVGGIYLLVILLGAR